MAKLSPHYLEELYNKLEFDTGLLGIDNLRDASKAWFQDSVKNLRAERSKLLKMPGRSIGGLNRQNFIGRMFLYEYDPKTKKDLPYYDRLPLVFPFKLRDDGWIGLNMHYLSPKDRGTLFKALISLRSAPILRDKSYLQQLRWEVLDGVAKYRFAKPCVKRYLSTHIRSQLIPVKAPYWSMVLYLPVANFRKASKTTVWTESRRKAKW